MRAALVPPLLASFAASLAVAAPAPFAPALLGPEVVKLDWNTRALLARDLDGDGRADLALLNNDRAAIELLYQLDPAAKASAASPAARRPASANRWEPVLEDARFRRETRIVGQGAFDLVAADFNGDGRVDLALTGEPAPLLLLHARADGEGWDETPVPTAPAPSRFPGALHAGDIDGDGLDDLVILGPRELAVCLQRPGLGLSAVERMATGEENPFGLTVADFDGDGRPDIAYLAPGRREALRLRRQIAPGRFGPETAYPLKTPRSPLIALRSAGKGAAPLFASALGASGQIEFTRVAEAAPDPAWRGLAPRVYSPGPAARGAAFHAVGDFDGDGRPDLVAAHAETAQVFLYPRAKDGSFGAALRLPGLTDVRAIAAGASPSGSARDVIYVLSGRENTLAEIVVDADRAARPPRSLPVPGRLVAMAAGPLSATAPAGIALVAEEQGKRSLALWSRAEDGRLIRHGEIELKGLRTDPRAITLADLDQDGRDDVLVAVPGAGLRVYLQGEGATLRDAADSSAFRPGLLARPEAGAAPLAFGDVDGDGKPELLLGAENFLRALRVGPDGELVIVAQFDARDSGAEITTGLVLTKTGGEAPDIVLHDRKAGQLHLLRRAPGATAHETVDVRDVPRIDVTGALALPAVKGLAPAHLLLGRDRFWWMPEGAGDLAASPAGSYASDLPDAGYAYLANGDFNRDGDDELVAIDTDANTLELLSRDASGDWTSRLHFKVFDVDPHHQGGRGDGEEPRECVVADVTGDGRPDLVLLVHDRVLVYPQE